MAAPTTVPDPSAPEDQQAISAAFVAAREACRDNARSFRLAFSFLHAEKRQAVYAVMAFAGMIEAAIEDPNGSSAEAPLASCCTGDSLDGRLALFHDRLDDIYDHRLELPLPAHRSPEQQTLAAFELTVNRHQIPRQYFLDLAEARRMEQVISRYATWQALQRYCRLSAGAGGLIVSAILGLRNSGAAAQAVELGCAMRLTSILRDIKTDAQRGRVFLPLEDLARFRYSERELLAGVVNDPFRELMRFEITRARELYRAGAGGICWLADDHSRLAAATLAVMHAEILSAIEREGCDVLAQRAEVGAARKFRRLPAAWRLARSAEGDAVPDVF